MFLFKRSQSSRKASAAKKAAGGSKNNKDNEKADYPTTKLPTFRGDSPFAGATLATGGSWLICEDHDGQPYWWNDVTGQWTYQLFSTQGPSAYLHAGQQQQTMAALYSPQYVPSHPWLVSPAGQYHHTPWSPEVSSLATGWWAKQDNVNEASNTLGGVGEGDWVKYYDDMGMDSWINSVTGERTSLAPSVM